ncbi:MAG: iron ABC transporter permease [Treponemataceae bacterium]|nr:iron ABC transporter permease [Treponemataceae bacterium]
MSGGLPDAAEAGCVRRGLSGKRAAAFAGASALLALAVLASVLFGAQRIPLSDFFRAISGEKSYAATVLFSLRLPRALLAAVSGALLAASGAAFQMYFRNPLAEPGIIGISAGATLGAVLAQSFGLSGLFFWAVSPVNLCAFAGALVSGAAVVLISCRERREGGATLLLCGAALGTLYASISSIILLTQSRSARGIYTWILGSFNGRGWTELQFIAVPAAASAVLLFIAAPRLDLMAGGERSAGALGVETARLRGVVLTAAALAVSSSVCAGGTIGFVGLIAPHIARRIFGSRGRTAVGASMLFGAILLLAGDLAARTVIAPAELPAGLITSMLGAPFFICLIFSRE